MSAAMTSRLEFAFGLPLRLAADLNIIKVAMIVEGTQPHAAPGEGLVLGPHAGLPHVVEKNFDQARSRIVPNFYLVPSIRPRCRVSVFQSDRLTVATVDDHDLAGMGIGLCSQMDVVKMSRILTAPE